MGNNVVETGFLTVSTIINELTGFDCYQCGLLAADFQKLLPTVLEKIKLGLLKSGVSLDTPKRI